MGEIRDENERTVDFNIIIFYQIKQSNLNNRCK